MKKMRRILSALLAMSMVFTLLAVSASAAAVSPAANTAVPAISACVPATVRALAYTDTAKATAEQKEAILAARHQIVFGDQSWTVDGAGSILHADGTIEYLPEFSDLWPDWDLAEISGLTPDPYASLNSAGTNNTVHFDNTITIPPQSGSQNAPIFYRFNANGKIVYAWMDSMDKDGKCNIGYNNEDTGEFLIWRPGKGPGEKVLLNTKSGVRYGVRASFAGSVWANASMIVSEDPNYVPIGQG